MYEKIYQSLKEFINNQLIKSIKKREKEGVQLTSKLGKSTIIGREKELQEIDQQLNNSNILVPTLYVGTHKYNNYQKRSISKSPLIPS